MATMKERYNRWYTLLKSSDGLEVSHGINLRWFKYAVCRRNIQIENDDVYKNFKKVFKTFGTDIALKCLRTDGFGCRLGNSDTSAEFCNNLISVFTKYCNNNSELFAKVAFDSFFAHIGKEGFLGALHIIFSKIFSNNCALLSQFVSAKLCPHLCKAGYANKLVRVFDQSKLDSKSFAQKGGNKDFLEQVNDSEFDAAEYFLLCVEVNKWTEEETMRLKSLFEKNSNAANIDFVKLAENRFPGRSSQQVRDKFISLEGKNTPKGHWSEADDNQLIQLLDKHGKLWKRIGEEMTTKRAGNAVRKRFIQAKSPKSTAASKKLREYAQGCEHGVKPHNKWTEEDLERLVDMYKKTPNQWTPISKEFPGRTADDLMKKWKRASNSKKKNPTKFETAVKNLQKLNDIGK